MSITATPDDLAAQAKAKLRHRTTEQLRADYTEALARIASETDQAIRDALSIATEWIADVLAERIGWVALDAFDDVTWTEIATNAAPKSLD